MPRKYKQKAKFTAIARCLVSPDVKGKQFALASLKDLKTLLPADAAEFPDLLPIAGNICVANMGNGNGDMIDTETALLLAPKFINKYINIEHDGDQIVGHITRAGLTAFNANYAVGSGSDILKPEDVTGTSEPFNIGIGGYLYKEKFPAVAAKIEQANDPDHPEWLSVAFSWEVAFDENKLFVVPKDGKGVGEVIEDPEKIKAWSSYLKSSDSGTGYLPDGRQVYRLISWARQADGSIDPESVFAMGVALTLAPAAKVAGVVTPSLTEEQQFSSASAKEKEQNQQKFGENNSQLAAANVTSNTTRIMYIKSLKELQNVPQESLKDVAVANIQTIVEQEIQQAAVAANEKYVADINKEKEAVVAAQQKAQAAETKVEELQTKLSSLTEEIANLKAAQQQAVANQQFNDRMASFDEKFELDDNTRKAIASQIKGLDDNAFKGVAETLNVLLAPRDKAAIAAAKQQSNASQQQDPKAVAAAALSNASVTTPSVPNTPAVTQKSLADELEAEFSGDNIVITANRK